MDGAGPRVRDLMRRLHAIGARERDEIERNVPKVMRRVGGYNIDLCSTRRASGRTPPTAASTTRTCWSAAKARSRGPAPSR